MDLPLSTKTRTVTLTTAKKRGEQKSDKSICLAKTRSPFALTLLFRYFPPAVAKA